MLILIVRKASNSPFFMSHMSEFKRSFCCLRVSLVNIQLLKNLNLNRKSKIAPSRGDSITVLNYQTNVTILYDTLNYIHLRYKAAALLPKE